MANVSEILDSINGNVLTGGRRTKASGVRETLALIAESYLNKEDDADVAGGYLKISDTEVVDVSFIKKTVPTGQFLKDDGTWADAESLSTNTIFLGNDDLTYNSGWADGDTLLAQKNTIYYLQNGSPGETLTITIDDVDVEAGSMVAFTDGQAAGDGIQGTARILDAIPSAGGDINVYSGETVIYRFDGTVWRLMMRYSRNLISQSIILGATRFAPSADAVFTALAGKVNTTLTLTINGVTQNLAANRSWTIDALPSQTGNSGKFLTTNGTVASWASLSNTNITDALTYTPVNKAGDTLSGFLTLHADPTNSMHAVTKNYVDNLLTGLTWKEKVRVATTANITLSGTQTIDTVAVSVGDRVLVKNQSTQTENGIYVVSAGSWTRSTDADTGVEISTAAVLVTTGSQGNTQWTCSNSTTPTIGSTNITFAQIAGAGVYTNGTGILLSGNAFSLDLTRVATNGVTGLLSSTDWSTFNGKQNALNGTGFVKISGTTISYDNSTYVDLTTSQTITGQKTFSINGGNSQTGTGTGTVIANLDCNNFIRTGRTYLNVTGSSVTLGANSGHNNLSNTTIVGANSGNWSMSGQYISIFGNSNAASKTSGIVITAIGSEAVNQITSGNYITALGWGSAYNVTTATNCVYLGHGAGRALGNQSNRLAIDAETFGKSFPFIYGEFDNSILAFNVNRVGVGTKTPSAVCQVDLASTSLGLGLNRITSLPSYLTRKANFGFDDTLNVPVITLDRASNATSSWFEIATKNTASKAATAADGGAITNWSGNTDYFYTTTVAGAKLGQNVLVNFDATLGALINGTNVAINAYVSATNTVIVWVRTGTYVPPTTLSGNLLISVI